MIFKVIALFFIVCSDLFSKEMDKVVTIKKGIGMSMRKCPESKLVVDWEKEGVFKEYEISEFWIMKRELTQEYWEIFSDQDYGVHCSLNNFKFNKDEIGGKYPLFNVSYGDSLIMANHINQLWKERNPEESKFFEIRLPTEAEWEVACRAGGEDIYEFGNERDESMANLKERALLVPSGSLQPNKWGIYDMHGNVSEWVLDAYPSRNLSKENPVSLHYFDVRFPLNISRGGYQGCVEGVAASRHRAIARPDGRSIRHGFRLVLARIIPKSEAHEALNDEMLMASPN